MQINSLGKQVMTGTAITEQNPHSEEFAQKLDQALAQPKDAKEAAKLKQACRDMEAVFLNMLLKSMRSTVPKNGLLGNSSQEEIMRSLLDGEMTKNMAQAGGVGIAEMLYRQLTITDRKTVKNQAPR